LASQKFNFTVLEGRIFGNIPAYNAVFWDVDVSNSLYDNGAQTMVLQRDNPGIEDVKIGGASYVWLKYKDADGSLLGGDYYKWADGDDMDGALSLFTSSSLILATICALF